MSRNLTKPISASLEDYLEVIYETINEKQGVKAIDISRKLGVGRSSVTDALKNLAEKIGMTEGGFFQALRNKSLKVETLEEISKVLNVPLLTFFDNQEMFFDKRVSDLEKKLTEKEKYIKVLEEHISLLKDIREGRIK